MYQLDALKPIPEHLIGQYDVVHVRHMILVIKDSEIAPALLNLMKMISKLKAFLSFARVTLYTIGHEWRVR